MRATAPAAVLLLALAAVPPAEAAGVVPFSLEVDGVLATGLVGVPDGPPKALVVMCHGHGNTVEAWRGHLQAAADRGYLAVAMDYSPFFDLDRGAAETNAAARLLADGKGLATVALFAVSMGGGVCGLALAEAPPRADGTALYDVWFDIEGVSNLAATWAEAVAVGHPAAGQIEAETGGTPLEVPQGYVRRSPLLRGADIAARVQGAVVVHALNDGLVPYDQGRAMSLALRAAGVPTDMVTAVRGDPAELGTQGTQALGLPNPAHLAGHAWEGSSTHIVMRTGLDRLWAWLDGSYAPLAGESLVDEELGELP